MEERQIWGVGANEFNGLVNVTLDKGWCSIVGIE
jgi:hypothetical protein